MGIFNRKLNVLVLGNNGMLGYLLYNDLVKLSSEKDSKIGKVVGIDVQDGIDLTKLSALDAFLKDHKKFDYCINCVAYTNTKAAETTTYGKDLDYRLNALAPRYIAESCKKNHMKLIHISTDYVFSEKSVSCQVNGNALLAFTTTSEPFPVNTYGYDKLLGEMNIKEVFGENSKDYAILRTSWIYGMHNSKSFIHKFLKNVATKLNNVIDTEITMTYDEVSVPTSVQYLIDCILDIIKNKRHGTFHSVPLLSQKDAFYGVSRLDFAKQILKAFLNEKYRIGDKYLSQVALTPVNSISYLPHYSAMENTLAKDHSFKNVMTWTEDLERFMKTNKEALFDEIAK